MLSTNRDGAAAGHAALLLANLVFGLFPVLGRVAMEPGRGVTPFALAAWRICAGALIFWLLAVILHRGRLGIRLADLPTFLGLAVLGIVAGVARTLAYVHSAKDTRGADLGIVHRDVNPSNILIAEDGTTRLLDFGVAKAVERITTTAARSIKGKLAYLAPEQAERRLQRHRYDTITEGIGLDRVTANFRRARIDKAVRVPDLESVEMARYLLRNEGIFVGSSSAAHCVGAVRVARELPPGSVVVTMLCDTGQRHLTKFYSAEYLAKVNIEPRAEGSSLDWIK